MGRETVPLAGGIVDALSAPAAPPRKPGFALTIFSILLPVLLMAMATGTALGELLRCSGSQFDPQVVRAFVDATGQGQVADARAA